MSEENKTIIYNDELYEILKILAQRPEDETIKITAGTIRLLSKKGRHNSEHLRAVWRADNLPSIITGNQARQLLQKMEEARNKVTEK